MLRILIKRTMLAVSMIVVLAVGTAAAQEPRRAGADERVVSLSRLSASAFVPPSDAPARMAGDDDKETHRWDAIKKGFYTGLIVGGVVGVALVRECGHPECGPLLSLAAGVGASIGIGIDALVDRRPALEGVSAHDRPRGGGRLSIAIRKSW